MSGTVGSNVARSSGIVAAAEGGSVDTGQIVDNAVTLAKMAGGTDGQILTYDASGNPVAVGPGTDGQVLTSTGAGSPPAFETASGITSSDQSVCKAWVNFDGTGTVSIRDSYGVSSITDRGTGVYTVNFSSAFGNSLFNGTVSATIGGATNNNRVASTAPVSTTTAYLNTWEGSSANDSDVNHICGSYFGD